MPNVSFVFFDHGGTLSRVSKEHPQIVFDVLKEQGYEFSFEQVVNACKVSEAWWNENQDLLPRGRRRPLLIESHVVLLRNLGVSDSTGLAEEIEAEWHLRAGFTLYPDTVPCLEELKRRGIPLGIITQNLDTNEEFRSHALRTNGIDHYFSVIATSESVGYDKPDPRLFLRAAKLTGFAPKSIVYVGDKFDLDIRGAEAAGMKAVLINRAGISSPREVRTISSLSELSQLLI